MSAFAPAVTSGLSLKEIVWFTLLTYQAPIEIADLVDRIFDDPGKNDDEVVGDAVARFDAYADTFKPKVVVALVRALGAIEEDLPASSRVVSGLAQALRTAAAAHREASL